MITKQASFNYLIEDGYDFDTAAEMIKEASRLDSAKAVVSGAYSKAKGAVSGAYGKTTGAARNATDDAAFNTWRSGQHAGDAVKAVKTPGHRMDGVKALARNGLVQIGAGLAATGAAGVGGYAATREKQAAINELVSEGYDFDTAVAMVKQY
jgi:hypothetical protein